MQAARSVRLFLTVLSALVALPAPPVHGLGGQFGVEFAIDAPWRLEPAGGGYGPIPIVITFHDAVFESARSVGGHVADAKVAAVPQIFVGKFKEVLVEERLPDQSLFTTIPVSQVREIERKLVVSTKDAEPRHDLCRPYLGEDCDALLDITSSHEWHAVFWYAPKAPVHPGRNIHLVVALKTESGGKRLEWVNSLVVHAGEEPLPRFGNHWLYGDLHYHSQMTDNEGESGYSYRNVIRALGALGLDFVFATDHASNSLQVDGGLQYFRCGTEEGPICNVLASRTCHDGKYENVCRGFKKHEARDLNPHRYNYAKTIIYGEHGANDLIARDAETNGLARLRSAGILPQIYMGEEVDAWPEISAREKEAGAVKYGNGLSYFFVDARFQEHSLDGERTYLTLDEQGLPIEENVTDWVEENLPSILGSKAVQNVVAFVAPDGIRMEPSRQHIVYFPKSNDYSMAGFVGSDTRVFGGASKPLEQVIAEIEAGGYAFLAHPLTSERPSGPGPDIVPYSEVSLGRAWKSEAILGLQLWNENDIQYARRDCDEVFDDSRGRYLYLLPFTQTRFPWVWAGGQGRGTVVIPRQLAHGAFTWDRYLRKGLRPEETEGLPWLPKGLPRKWFMAGGSDAHGDLNYRRQGVPSLDRWCDSPVTDTAIGKPRNLVRMAQRPSGGRYSNRQVIDALRAGQFSVTDGPALRLAIDRNGNGKMDDADLQMGSTFEMFPGEHLPLLVEWKSTQEFGPIEEIHVYLGNALVTFAVDAHGPTHASLANDPSAYQPDPSGVLRIKPGAGGQGMAGVASLYLSPSQFGLVADGDPLFYVRAYAVTARAPFGGVNPATGFGQSCPAGARCSLRYAYTNPIWGRYHSVCPQPSTATAVEPASGSQAVPGRLSKAGGGASVFGQATVLDRASLRTASRDQDGNGIPDTCERDVPDPCPAPAGPGGKIAQFHLPVEELSTRLVGPAAGSAQKPPPPRSCQSIGGAPLPIGGRLQATRLESAGPSTIFLPAETVPRSAATPAKSLDPLELPARRRGSVEP